MGNSANPDRYTKAVLTIIAVCLVWICLRDVRLFPRAFAQGPVEVVDVRLRGIEWAPGQKWDAVFVKSSEEIPVKVRESVSVPVVVQNEVLPVDVKRVAVQQSLVPLEKKK
ncbi:MAG: hypothetical protein ACE5LV_05585 [Candidatus Aminicenantales bacterium]